MSWHATPSSCGRSCEIWESAFPHIRRDLGVDRGNQRARLDQCLLELSLRIGVGDDPTAGPKPQASVLVLERADGDTELEARHRTREPDGAGLPWSWKKCALAKSLANHGRNVS